jgi:hypothetical protein
MAARVHIGGAAGFAGDRTDAAGPSSRRWRKPTGRAS